MPTKPISTDLTARLDNLRTVSLSEAGAFDTMAGCERAGIAIVAELHSVEEADALAASRYGHRIARVLIEPNYRQRARARAEAVAIHATLKAAGVSAPQFSPDAEPALAVAA